MKLHKRTCVRVVDSRNRSAYGLLSRAGRLVCWLPGSAPPGSGSGSAARLHGGIVGSRPMFERNCALMLEIAHATFTFEHFPEVMTMLWKRMLQDNKKNWRRTYKSLLLLNYLVRNGSERVVTSSREHIYDLRGLENYVYVDEFGRDQGINISPRRRVKVATLLLILEISPTLSRPPLPPLQRQHQGDSKPNADLLFGLSLNQASPMSPMSAGPTSLGPLTSPSSIIPPAVPLMFQPPAAFAQDNSFLLSSGSQSLPPKGSNPLDDVDAIPMGVVTSVRGRADRAARECLAAISDCSSLTEAEPHLAKMASELPGEYTEQKMAGIDEETDDLEDFGSLSYARLLGRLCQLRGFPNSPAVRRIIVCNGNSVTMFSESLHHLTEALKESHFPSSRIDSILDLLYDLATSDAFVTPVLRFSMRPPTNRIVRARLESVFTKYCQSVASLPEKVANQTQGKSPEKFSLQKFGTALLSQTVKIFKVLTEAQNHVTVDPNPVAILLGRLSTCLFLGDNCKNMVGIFDDWVLNEVGFESFIHDVLMNINHLYIERFAVLILQYSSNPEKLLGSKLIESSSAWKHIMCKKLPFLSFSNDEVLISNLVKYLNYCGVLESTFLELVSVWSDRSALNHTPYDQHLYLTKIIILAVKLCGKNVKSDPVMSQNVMVTMARGIPNHLESLVGNVRAMGMVTGEAVINAIQQNDSANVLQFDYDQMNDEQARFVSQLKNYDFVLSREAVKSCSEILESLRLAEDEKPRDKPAERVADDLDSDDDFEPYDLSNDVKSSVAKRPKYLRDLIEGLVEEKDVDVFVESVVTAPSLIRNQLGQDDVSLALELAQLFITLSENFHCENFEQLRFEGLVNTILVYPAPCAEYLASQFHGAVGKYSISTRLLILEGLRAAAVELSKVETSPDVTPVERILKTNIIGKTRRIAGPTVVKQASENKFAKVAGSFFYPLVRGEHQNFMALYSPTQSSHDDTSLLLEALLKTLAVVVACSQNLGTDSLRMAGELLEGVWLLRFHPSPSIIHAVIVCIAAVATAIPENLLDRMLDDLIECREWLDSPVIVNSPHLNQLANQVSAFLQVKVSSFLMGKSEITNQHE
ncbi:unnamed protein product [Nesidiocoris tenuis]|uniref:ENTH domain-containing protein n=1 Tax=Nesidiocoris tenuis TaxID=355587 RepID=A0A6H5H086_9HEMI|nr:unnamed protein product [Nesidiocoris tenuis]